MRKKCTRKYETLRNQKLTDLIYNDKYQNRERLSNKNKEKNLHGLRGYTLRLLLMFRTENFRLFLI